MKLTIQQKIAILCQYANISQSELARRMGMKQSNFSQRLKTGKFSDEDFEKIASAVGAVYFSGFKFEDGHIIE